MKKLLALVLVLGMASMASAALIINADDLSDVGLSTDTAISAYKVTLVNNGGVMWDTTGFTAGPLHFDFDSVINGDNGVELVISGSQFLSGPVGPGGLFSGVALSGEGTVDVFDTLGSNRNLLGTITVPEPMTMSLLGLGGLALIRRRRA
jgi:hypothetical protein